MNERIHALVHEAGLSQHNSEGTDSKLEKFAQLIIQECLLSLEPDSYASELGYEIEEKIYTRSAGKIKQHFGVSV